ncbi:XRE family transcriptional regulator [Saccharopolyspora thermophila]|uniref:XRE family transcriptional regulator n=1 Tax=Saccharopolyspora thermophila TaxID=89367 RepID=A0ABP3M5U2_9PSEU
MVQAGTIVGDVHVQSAGGVPVPRQLPPVPFGFVGRDEQLAALDATVAPGRGLPSMGPSVALVCGTAGVGKTALVLHWAHRVSGEFPDGQLYVDLRGFGPSRRLDAGEVLAGFLRSLGVPTPEVPEDAAERAALYRSLLAGRRVLVVLDNAGAEDQVRPLLPGSSSCSVVITSRRVLSGLVAAEGAMLVRVGLLHPDDALALLRRCVGPRVDEDLVAAAEVCRDCAGLPLALRVAGQVICCRPSMSLAELAADLADRRARLDVLDSEDDPSTSARAVFSWSYEQLNGQAARAFRLLGTYPGHSFDSYTVAALLDVAPREARRVLDTLARAHLVVETARGRFDMHDLLRAYAGEVAEQQESDIERGAVVRRLFDYYLHTADQADRVLTPHRYRVALDCAARPSPDLADYDSALAWLDAERANISAVFQAQDPVLDRRVWQLAYTMRGYYFLTKQWKDWTQTHELALAATQRTGDRYAEAQTRNNLGLALLEQGHWDLAAEHYDRARELFEAVGDIHGVSNALANRATVLHYRGDLEAALRENERALACYEQSGSDRNVAITLRSMALIEIDLGRFDDAVARLERATASFSDLGLQMDRAMALNCLGEAHHRAGNDAAARRAHEQALMVSNDCGSRFEYARAQHGLGRVAKDQGHDAEAFGHWEEALKHYAALGAPEATQLAEDLAALQRTMIPPQRAGTPG